jgi:hypothetical protein
MQSTRVIPTAVVIALILFVSALSQTSAADVPSVEWSRTYNNLEILSIIQTSDGGYAIAGASWSSDAATFIKINSSGNLQWQKTQGTIVSVVQTWDSGYALFHNNYIVKTDAEGDVQSTLSLGFDDVRRGIITRDGEYVLVGNSRGVDGEYFAWLYKVDAQGNILWNRTYTGGYTVYDVTETPDRGCALAGSWKNDFWLIKIDSNGNREWSQTYSYGAPLDVHSVNSLAATKDGGFILAGTGEWQASGGFVPWLIKINPQGHEQWSLPYGHIPQDSFTAVVQTDDEGYVLALGNSARLMRTDTSGSDLWTLRLDEAGVWNSSYSSSCLIRTKDGGYAIAGTAFGNSGFITKISPEYNAQSSIVVISSPQNKTYETSDIPLIFTVNKPVSWIGYSLDGQDKAAIAGNTTLSGLAIGEHNVIVYIQDSGGDFVASEQIHFTVVPRFPTEWIVAGIFIATLTVVGFLAYFKRQSLSAYKKMGFRDFFQKRHLFALTKNKMLWTLIIIVTSILLVFVQIFFPYAYYSASSGPPDSAFEVGISYVYEQDSLGQIYDEVARIKKLGFRLIRINMIADSVDPSAYSNTLTDVFFRAVRQLDIRIALVINNHDEVADVNYYLEKWGSYLTYVQILNEPDVASSWDMGALFTDDEAGSRFEEIYTAVAQHQLSVQYYTNFGPAFLIRTNLPVQFSETLDFVGFDIFMESFLTLSPRMIQLLQKITNKEVVISEFGMSTSDDTKQANYIINGLNLFRSMGLRGCWIVYWNSINNVYGIRGRLAEQKVSEWIAQNTQN